MIRAAKLNDASAIAKVHIDCWRSTYSGIISEDYLSRLNYEKRTKSWNQILSKSPHGTFVAGNREIVGFASGGINREQNEFAGELYALYILQAHQYQGLGKKLFLQITNYLIENEMGSMEVWVLKDNPAVNFYKKMGGVFIGDKEIKIGGKNLIEQCFVWKDL